MAKITPFIVHFNQDTPIRKLCSPQLNRYQDRIKIFVAPFACQDSGQAPQHQCVLQMAAKPLEPVASVNRQKSGANTKSIWKKLTIYVSRNLDQTPISSFSDLGSLICAKEDFSPEVSRYLLQEKIRPTGVILHVNVKTPNLNCISFNNTLGFPRNSASRALSFWSLAIGSLNSMHCVSISIPKNCKDAVGKRLFCSARGTPKLREMTWKVCNKLVHLSKFKGPI